MEDHAAIEAFYKVRMQAGDCCMATDFAQCQTGEGHVQV